MDDMDDQAEIDQAEIDKRATEEMRRYVEASVAQMMASLDPEPTEIDTGLFRLLMICAHRVSVEMMTRIDVGESAMTVLVLLLLSSATPPCSPRALAAALGSSRAAATQLLNRMERGGLIERAVSRTDRRARNVLLTDAARRAWKTAHAPLCLVMQKATSSLTSDEKLTLLTLLERVERDVDHARVMRAWSDAEPERLEAPRVAETREEDIALRERERVRRSGVHTR